MLLSDRSTPRGGRNAIARARDEIRRAGIEATDLSDSNPTRHGLLLPEALAAVERHARDDGRYEPDPRGAITARIALAEAFGGDPDAYWLTSSTSQAYAWLAMLLTDPGQAIAVPAPGYPLIPPIAQLAGATTIDYRYHYAHPHGWILDRESLSAAALAPTTRAVVAVNPGNPTGAYVGRDDVVEACAEGGCALISDEVFRPFVVDGDRRSLAGEAEVPTFTLGGLSKLVCAPQLKLAWIRLSGPAGDIARIRDGLDTIADAFLPVSGPIAAALPDILGLADRSVSTTRARLAANLAALRDVFATGPYRVRRCDGGWTALLDVPAYGAAEGIVIHLLREAHLAVHPGWFYDIAGDTTLALSLLPAPIEFAASMRRLRTAIDAMGDRE